MARCLAAASVAARALQTSRSSGAESVHSGPWSSSRRAGATGGSHTGRPRQPRIASVVSSGWIVARIRIGPWQRGHSSTSIAKTRFRSSAHASRLRRAAAGGLLSGSGAWVAESSDRADSQSGPEPAVEPEHAASSPTAADPGWAPALALGSPHAAAAPTGDRVRSRTGRARSGSGRDGSAAVGRARRASRRAPAV